jgi:peptidoglycan/LPS O-acetylase OafA/YrhL
MLLNFKLRAPAPQPVAFLDEKQKSPPVANQMKQPSRVIRDIEVLRALAVLFTIFNHRSIMLVETRTHVIDPYFQFWGGVDIFFVVSGFVISHGLLASRRNCATETEFLIEVVGFWIRRIWRIWPTAWFWVAISLIMTAITSSNLWGWILPNLQAAVSILLNIENFHQISIQAHALPTIPSQFEVYWSLSLEEQFYVLLPLVLILFRYRFLGLFCATAVAVQIFLPRPVSNFLWWIRTDALLLGVVIGLSFDSPKIRFLFEPSFLRRARWLSYFTTSLLLFLIAGLSGQPIVSFSTGAIAALAAVLVWLASFDASYILPEGWPKRAFVWVGSRSFALYLIHVPAFLFTREIWHHLMPLGTQIDGRFTLRLCCVWTPLVLILAEINYRLIEQPLRRRGATIARLFIARHRAIQSAATTM